MAKNRGKNLFLLLMVLFIIAGSFNCSRVLYAQENTHCMLQTANLSPALKLPEQVFQESWRDIIVDFYMRSSILSEYEYRVLKLNVLFNVKINPADIERSLLNSISKEDIPYYFYEATPDKDLIRKTRLKIRNKFEMILIEYGWELDISMLRYLEALMKKIAAKQDKDISAYQMQITKVLNTLTDEEMLLFKAQPRSLQEHALKKKVMYLVNGEIVKEGVLIDSKVGDAVADAVEAKKQNLLSQVRFYVNIHKDELKQQLYSELLSEISYYSARHSRLSLQRQKVRAEAFGIFMEWLKSKESTLSFDKVTLYKEGELWESRYWFMLDEIMRELIEAGSLVNIIPELPSSNPPHLQIQNSLIISQAI